MSRWILITGCSSGIGLDAAIGLQRRGYKVIATLRTEAGEAGLRDAGVEHILRIDLGDSESIRRAVDDALQLSGGALSAVFNNAAYGQPGAVEDISRQTLRQQFETNLFGTHELTQLLLPGFLRQPDARVINCSSVLGLVSMKYRGAYNASKYALEGLTDTLRLEMLDTPVKVSLIEPGPILSRFRENALAAFEEHIDVTNSRHRDAYEDTFERLKKPGAAMKFTLGPEAVTKKLIHALEASRPRARYYVTVPTYIAGVARRLLSTRALDRLMAKGSG